MPERVRAPAFLFPVPPAWKQAGIFYGHAGFPGTILPRFHTGPVAALTFPFYNRPDPANHKKTNQEEIT